MPFDDGLVKDVLDRADIVKVISSYLSVTKKGKNYVAKCPFHDDNNPSLTISPEKRLFKCFVCGTSGNAISFVQKYEHVTFMEAIRKVADIIGFHDPRLEQRITVSKPVDTHKVTLLKCLHDLTVYYQYALSTPEGKEGLDYFESRNLDSNLRSKFLLGYAFKDGKATCQFLQSKGHSLKTIEDIGIASTAGGVYSDRNQGRAVFPICNEDGDVIGYSARRLKQSEEAKYVNSPETYLFHKSSILYNYHNAKEKARIAGYVYVLEGFMDVFALAKIGFDSAVAIMGTSLTNEHIAMLRKLGVEVRLCLDGDLPGQTAMMKAAKQLQQAGIKFRLVNNQNNKKDPDEILNQDGPDALRVYLENLTDQVEFVLSYYKNSNPLKTSDQKKALIKEFVPILVNTRSALELDNYLRKLAGITGYEVETLRIVVEKARQLGSAEKAVASFHPERKILRKLELAERELLYQMANNAEAVAFYEAKVGGFYDEIYRHIANFMIEYSRSHDGISSEDLISFISINDPENGAQLIDELTGLCLEETHPDICTPAFLEEILNSINKEKYRISEEDTLKQSLEGKDELEKARIMAEYNRRKIKG